MDDERRYIVNSKGKIIPMMVASYDEDKTESTKFCSNSHFKLIVPRKTSESLKNQLKYPGKYIQNSTSSSFDIRDYVGKGCMTNSNDFSSRRKVRKQTFNINTWT
jgi:hypothetical protein